MTYSVPALLMVGALGLVLVGLYGLIVSRNLIKIVISLQLMSKGALLALVAAGAGSGRVNLGQSLAMTVIVVDTMVAVVGLALAVRARRQFGTLDMEQIIGNRG